MWLLKSSLNSWLISIEFWWNNDFKSHLIHKVTKEGHKSSFHNYSITLPYKWLIWTQLLTNTSCNIPITFIFSCSYFWDFGLGWTLSHFFKVYGSLSINSRSPKILTYFIYTRIEFVQFDPLQLFYFILFFYK